MFNGCDGTNSSSAVLVKIEDCTFCSVATLLEHGDLNNRTLATLKTDFCGCNA
jgi:hypothetical protein